MQGRIWNVLQNIHWLYETRKELLKNWRKDDFWTLPLKNILFFDATLYKSTLFLKAVHIPKSHRSTVHLTGWESNKSCITSVFDVSDIFSNEMRNFINKKRSLILSMQTIIWNALQNIHWLFETRRDCQKIEEKRIFGLYSW